MVETTFVILAGGNSSRFKKHSKLLYPLCGRLILDHVIDKAGSNQCILIASEAIIRHEVSTRATKVILQSSPTGTADGLILALPEIADNNHVFVLLGDSPLISDKTIQYVLDKIAYHDLIFGGFKVEYDNSYGRIKKNGDGYRILEKSEHPESVDLYNAGWMCFNRSFIDNLPLFNRKHKEAYITQFVEYAKRPMLVEVGHDESIGINSLTDFQIAHQVMQKLLINNAFNGGVRFIDPSTVRMNFDTIIEPDAIIDSNVVFGPNVVVRSNATILPFSYLEKVEIGNSSKIGPFAYIRGDSVIADKVEIGAFCEVNRTKINSNTKAKHLSYLGDAIIGTNVNIGAGNVFCNYDGQKKSTSIIEDNVFLGGNCAYVAPIKIGSGSYIGAGTVIRNNVDKDHLVVANPPSIKYNKGNAQSKRN